MSRIETLPVRGFLDIIDAPSTYAGQAGKMLLVNPGEDGIIFSSAVSPGAITLTQSHILVGNASNVAADVAMSGDATIASSGALTLVDTAVTPGSYGDSTNVTSFTVDSKGRLTAAANVPISITSLGTPLTRVNDTNVTLTLTGFPSTALVNATEITVGWSGLLALARGGTNKNMTAVNGGVVWTDSDSMEVTAAGSAGQLLASAGAASPIWTTPTYPTISGTSGKFLQSDGTNIIYSSATFPTSVGATGTILRSDGTNWVASTNTYPNTTGANQILYATSANVIGSNSAFSYDGTNLVNSTSGGGLIIGASAFVSSENLLIREDQNGLTWQIICNATSGTAARSAIAITNSSTGSPAVTIQSFSAAYTTSGISVADTGGLISSKTAGLNIGTTNSAQLSFWTNNTQVGIFLPTGEFILGASAVVSGEYTSIQKSQNAATNLRIKNATSGTAAGASITVTDAANLSCAITSYSAGFTSSGISVASTGALVSNQTGGLNVGTTSNAQVSFWANNTKYATLLSTGEFLFGATALTSSEYVLIRKDFNGPTWMRIYNNNSGSSAVASYNASNGTALCEFGIVGTGGTGGGLFGTANQGYLVANNSAPLAIGNYNASGVIDFYSGGSAAANARMRLLSTGAFLVGGTAVVSGETFGVQKSQNATTEAVIRNATNGTAAFSRWAIVNNDSTAVAYLGYTNKGYTTAGLVVADQALLISNTPSSFLIGTTASSNVIFISGGSATTNEIFRYSTTTFTYKDAINVAFGTTTGTKLGTATSQKIGFWNATPIVQPTTAVAAATFVANTSGIVNDTATWDGYTIGQVVKALRNAGILA